jgi:NTE family protein
MGSPGTNGWLCGAASFFHGLDDEALALIGARLRPARFAAGETVIAQGQRHGRLLVVTSGTAQVSVAGAAENEVVRWIAPGATVGEISLLTGQPATATVRAVTDLEVVTLSAADFQAVAGTCPAILRNLGIIMSQRVVEDSGPPVRNRDRLTLLLDCNAPPTLGYALACSLAWHTRHDTLLVVLHGGTPAPELLALAKANAPCDARTIQGRPRAHLLLSGPDGMSLDRWVSGRLTELTRMYDHVLLQVQGDRPPLLDTDRTVLMANASCGADAAHDRPRFTMCAWSDGGCGPSPNDAGVLHVQPLQPPETACLKDGLLPPMSSGSIAIGWAARDLAGLKVGIAFGGGAARGYAHLGVMQVLERTGVRPDFVAGTSIGAPIGALCSLGYSPAESLRIVDNVGRGAVRPTLPFTSILSSSAIVKGIRAVVGDTSIEDMPIPFAAVAADLLSGRATALRRGTLWKALMASMAIPGIYSPLRIGARLLVDGGLLEPVPTATVAEMGADKVIGIKLIGNSSSPWGHDHDKVWLTQVLRRSFDILQSQIDSPAGDQATVVIEPEIPRQAGFGLLRFTDGSRFIEHGHAAAEAALPRLAATLPWLKPIRWSPSPPPAKLSPPAPGGRARPARRSSPAGARGARSRAIPPGEERGSRWPARSRSGPPTVPE